MFHDESSLGLHNRNKRLEKIDFGVEAQMRTHFPFSIHGLIFLSGEWMRKSPFSLSSMNAFIASMDLLRGHLSIFAWNRMLAICKLRLSLSMLIRLLLRVRSGDDVWPIIDSPC